ncbi:hypothetical protein IE53DRAFT_390310 [Violaceomyces palustris]|uniref:Uncharacterized protein n=1 Tax=Violaceomyces palustris TaxID=1673888 RepID=A0ACD0NP49_9BASI|nr:hypothetical protein IE53DRAFT_390310 [Violaceomyces palustris]
MQPSRDGVLSTSPFLLPSLPTPCLLPSHSLPPPFPLPAPPPAHRSEASPDPSGEAIT